MRKYRKKPVVIEAMLFSTNNETDSVNMNDIVSWINLSGHKASHNNTDIYIETLEGIMKAEVGDYIIKGVKGEFYPCKSDIFKATYEEVREKEWNTGDEWCCEQHPDKPFPHDDCIGPGMPKIEMEVVKKEESKK